MLVPPPGRVTASACEPHRDFIELSLTKGRNAKAIYQDLVDDHGFTGRYASVKRFVRQHRGTHAGGARSSSRRQGRKRRLTTAPGQWCAIRTPAAIAAHACSCFTLGYSRKCVRLLTFQSSTRIWAELHEQAFRRLGGATKTVVLDNLGEGVLKPDIYDPALNPLYRDVLAHYSAVALPCRVADPDRKGKVERGVGHAKNTPLKGQRFESLEEAQAYLDRWEAHWADTRIHGTMKRQVTAMFAEEKPALTPLPLEPFRHYQFGERRVNLDGCVEVEAAYYSAPPGWIGRSVSVQWDGHIVRVLDPRAGQLLREHLRQQRGSHRIPNQDKPAKTPRTTAQLLARCAKIGGHIGTVAERMYARGGQSEIRRILGITSLARKHGAALVNDACAAALDSELPANPYRFLRHWLERKTPLTLRQVDPLIRQLTLYRDLIDQHTQEENQNEPHRTATQPASTPAGRHGRRAGNASASSASRADGAPRSARDPRQRRAHAALGPIVGAPPQTSRLPRSQQDARQLRLQFNPKLNRSLVFDLATGGFIDRREDALLLGPGGTGKSHLAQAIGQAAILQGHKVIYLETHVLLEELAEAMLDGTRKQYMESVSTVALLIIDDFGMRKLPQTAAEDLLEIVMRRYERASTLLTSNRPVEDWGKLLSDVAAVGSMLDRLLHHGHILKCGPRSWRTKTAPAQ